MRIRLIHRSQIGLDHELLWGAIGLVLALAALLTPFALLPYRCPFKVLTGIPCPTCGMTRGLIAARHLDFSTAFLMNPLAAVVAVGFGLFVVYAWIAILLRTRRIRLAVTRSWEPTAIRIGVVTVFLANWLFLIAVGR